MSYHNKTALKPAIAPEHYVKAALLAPVDKSERKGPILETVKDDGAILAMRLAKKFYAKTPQSLGLEAAKIAAEHINMSVDDLISSSKRQPDATWRQAAMFATVINGKSLWQTARAFKRRDHTTALHAFKVMQERIPGCPRSVPEARLWLADEMEAQSC